MMNDFIIVYNDELYHHGIKGMKWGVRRYQKYPGSYTKRGVKRFNESLSEYEKQDKRYKDAKKYAKEWKKTIKEFDKVAKNEHKQGLEDPRMPYKVQHELHKQAIRDDKIKVANARLARTKAKKKLSNDYDRLKNDKLADKGKELYARGKTIRGNNKVTNTLATIGGLSIFAGRFIGDDKKVNIPTGKGTYKEISAGKIISGIGALTLAGAIGKEVYDNRQNRKLRAYYSHSSKR